MSVKLTNKLRAFFSNYAKDAEEYYVDGYYEGGDAPILQALEDFGKQCFEASREEIHNLNFNDPAFGPSLKYSTFEKYLENLETK